MCVTWSYAGQRVDGFEELLACCSPNELASPKRSSVPLLAYWRIVSRRARELLTTLGCTPSASLRLDCGHQAPLRRVNDVTGQAWPRQMIMIPKDRRTISGRYGIALAVAARWCAAGLRIGLALCSLRKTER